MTIDGTWTITHHAGGREEHADITLTTAGEELSGTFLGAPVTAGHVQGDDVTFTAQLTSPFPMTMTVTATVDGDTIAGQAQAPGTSHPFTGVRTGAPLARPAGAPRAAARPGSTVPVPVPPHPATGSTPTIAIVGAGLGGLVLARVLQVNGIDATVYEADSSPVARPQGGVLDIHHDSGQPALRAAGVFEQFLTHTHLGAEVGSVMGRDGRVLVRYDSPSGEGTRPEIDRSVLRRLLIDSLGPDRIAWGHKTTAVQALGGGRHELTFAHGGTTSADLVVGADGTWSRVRPLLTPGEPAYTGVVLVELRIHSGEPGYDHASALVGPGSLFACDSGKNLLGHGGDPVWVGAGLAVPEDWPTSSGIDWTDAPAARAALLAEYADWSEDLTALIANSSDLITPRPIYAMPVGLRWDPVPGVTLVGDAAHVMSPFAGEGANLALQDGAELAAALLAHPQDPAAALARYETAMFTRAEASAGMSAQGQAMLFSPHAPAEAAEFFSFDQAPV